MYSVYAKYRDAKGLTDYQVANQTGIARATISEWKKGTYEPKADKLLAISKLLDCPLEELIKQRG